MATSNCSAISCSSTDIKEEDFEFAHLREFFDDSDWLRMSDIDKRRCAQLLRNYELLLQFGASPPVPDFLRKSTSPPKLRKSHRKKRKTTRYLQVRIKPNRTRKRVVIDEDDDDTKSALDVNTLNVASKTNSAPATQSSGIVRSTRQLRRKMVSVSEALVDKSPAAQRCTKVLSFANGAKEAHHKPTRLRLNAKRESRDLSRVKSRRLRPRVTYACSQHYCSKRFACLRQLLAHLNVCSEARPRTNKLHRCERCAASFRFSACLAAHTTRKHISRLFFCTHCDMVELTSVAYRKHILQCSAKAVACAACGKQLPTALRLRRHFFRSHPTLRYFKCRLCPMTFANQPGLLRHVQRAHVGRPNNSDYKCGACGKTYRNRSAFWLHKKSHDTPSFACEFCGRSFHTKSFLNRHARLHTESRPFLCEICGASFKQHAHLRTHEAEVCKLDSSKPTCFACEKCGLAFKRKSQLERHFNRKHSASTTSKHKSVRSEKPPPAGLKHLETSFDCFVCGAKFKSNAGLKRHTANVHALGQSSNTTFACSFCGRIFKCQEYLSKHLLCVHNKMDSDAPANAGWPPEKFACSVCPKSFKSEGYVRRHEQVRHGIAKKADPFECKVCGIGFRRRDYLKRHEANLHPSADIPSHASTMSLPVTKSTAPIRASQNLEVASGAVVSCQFCGKLFSTETFLRAHEDAVHGSAFNGILNNFLCRLCNSGFRRRRHLLLHFAAAHGAVPKQEPLSRDLDLAATMATATEPILSPQRQDVLFANASGASTFVLVAAPVVNPAPIPCFIIPARQVVTMATDPNAKNNDQIGVDSAPTEFSTDQFFAFLTETNDFRL